MSTLHTTRASIFTPHQVSQGVSLVSFDVVGPEFHIYNPDGTRSIYVSAAVDESGAGGGYPVLPGKSLRLSIDAPRTIYLSADDVSSPSLAQARILYYSV